MMRALFVLPLLTLACGSWESNHSVYERPLTAQGAEALGLGDDPCSSLLSTAFVDDGVPALSKTEDYQGPLSVLVVALGGQSDSPLIRHFRQFLGGMGLATEVVDGQRFEDIPWGQYSAAIIANMASGRHPIGAVARERLIEAHRVGLNVMWIGGGLDHGLGDLFGVDIVGEVAAHRAGVSSLRYHDDVGSSRFTPVYADEYYTRVKARETTALAHFLPNQDPALLATIPSRGQARAVLVPFGLLYYWSEDTQPGAWLRAEIVARAVTLVLSHGAILSDPFPRQHPGAVMVRVEDISPQGGAGPETDWINRLEDSAERMDRLGVPLNYAVIARYVNPATDEVKTWDSHGDRRQRLRDFLRERVHHGDDFIVHGFTHQYGTRSTDVTGVDSEFADDASGEWRFLPYEKQRVRIRKARKHLREVFQRNPKAWETPHYFGNDDTYRAAAEVGFSVISEANGNPFPVTKPHVIWQGNQPLWVPTTGSYIPYDSPDMMQRAMTSEIMPRLVRLRAPVFFFYHGFTDEQAAVLQTLAECAHRADFWSPKLSKFVNWWKKRQATTIRATRGLAPDRLGATVTNAPRGATVTFRLPDGAIPARLFVNGKRRSYSTQMRWGVAWVRAAVPDTDTATFRLLLGWR